MKRRALLVGWLAGGIALPAAALPSFAEVKAAHPTSETRFIDRHGELLQRQRTDPTVRQGAWVALPQVSPALRSALVYSEDRRFYEHSGIDWQAVAAAAWGNLWNTRTRGASTLTMQLAGLLEGDLKAGAEGRRWTQKAGQAVWAKGLETRWRKDQILEAYLNRVPFRGELVGIDALSRSLFAKAPHGLNNDEAAITAALVRAPNATPERVAARACEVQQAMARAQGAQADCLSVRLLTGSVLRERRWAASEGDAPHAARRALAEWRRQAGGRAVPAQLRTTLWAPLQREAHTLLERQLRSLQGRRVEDGAVVVLDNASGEVLAWVGSSGLLSQAAEVDGVTALRQPGSTLKPFLYAQAIAEKRLSAASLIEDAPTHIPTAGGLYIPQNYDRHFRGWVSVRSALASSLNIPAVRTLAMVSPEDFAAQLLRLGLPLREGGDYYGLGLALGSPEVGLLSLANAYRTLANQGRHSPVAPLLAGPRGAVRSEPVLNPGAAFIVGDILSDANARAATFGTDSLLATRVWTAVKTGTSKDMRDNWAVGWSQRYTVGVWVGNASGAPMGEVSGTAGAAPVWAGLMRWLHERQPSRAPSPPAGVVAQAVRFGQQLEPSRREWFIAGTEQPLFALGTDSDSGAPEQRPRILSPSTGTILALDPDIPPRHQRLTLKAEAGHVRWRLNGQPLGRGQELQWMPWPGRHRIELVNARGEVLDRVRIEVRGAGVVSAPRAASRESSSSSTRPTTAPAESPRRPAAPA